MAILAEYRMIYGAGLLALLVLVFIYLWWALPPQVQATTAEDKPKISAKHDLAALQVLQETDLEFSDQVSENEQKALIGRRVSRQVKRGEAVTDVLLMDRTTEERLKNGVQVTIPADANTTLGGLLKAGDEVDLLCFSAQKSTDEKEVNPSPGDTTLLIKDVVVLSVPAGQPSATSEGGSTSLGVIVISLPLSEGDKEGDNEAQLKRYAAALNGTKLMLLRKLPKTNTGSDAHTNTAIQKN